jgi:hypothetical protein
LDGDSRRVFLAMRLIVASAAACYGHSGLFLGFRIRLLPATAAFVLVRHGLILLIDYYYITSCNIYIFH